MLAELETGLVALLKASPLGKRLRQIDSLPDLEGDSLVGRFVSDSPAVYVALGSFPVKGGYAQPKFGIACVAKNSRGHQAARHGDGMTVGLQEMLDAVMAIVETTPVTVGEGEDADQVTFEVLSCDQIASEALYQKGVYVGVVQIQAASGVPLPSTLDEAALADFTTFHADYDVDPHQPPAEHIKWLQEPPDHSTSAPELSDTLNVQE